MADLVPAPAAGASLLQPLTDPAGGGWVNRLARFARQPAIARTLPWFGGIAAIGAAALLWLELAPAPQRVLYTELSDAERAHVTAALDKAAIRYSIDNQTGAITVGEDDLYKARMVAASDGALATPETGQQMIDKLPMGASRTVEGERLAAARERELELTVMQIDGVEAVRVHLAQPEKSAFVRDTVPPTASVMVRLARGRQLSASQVTAIINLVAGSVAGLSVDAVKVIDQQGHLLSGAHGGDADRLELQARLEDKLRAQVEALLAPMLGQGNFSSEIQVELDLDQQTSARETYDKQGAVRSETQSASQSTGTGNSPGIPGVLANTPPPQAQASPGTPSPSPSAAPSPVSSDSSTSRTYELGREVAVINTGPGKIRRLSVAVALSAAAMARAKPGEIDQIRQLVSAAVGAQPQRGDQVAVVVRNFQPVVVDPPKFWETPWFAMAVRNAVALIAVLLTLLLGVRPLIKALQRPAAPVAASDDTSEDAPTEAPALAAPETPPDPGALGRQVGLAQQLVRERPETAVATLRQMLQGAEAEGAA